MLLGKYRTGKTLVTISEFQYDQYLTFLSMKTHFFKHKKLFMGWIQLKFNYNYIYKYERKFVSCIFFC